MAMPDDELLRLLRGIVEDIHYKVGQTDWTKAAKAKAAKNQITLLLRRFDVAVDDLVPEMIAKEYFKGVQEASRLLVEEAIDTTTGRPLGTDGRIADEFRKPIYLDSLQEILDDTYIDLKAATRTAQRSAITTIDTTISRVKDEIAKGTISGNSRKVMQANVAKAFREGGMTSFITSDGKELPLDFYSMTVTRTKIRDAGVKGAATRYEDNNQDLVQVVGNGDSCEVCAMHRDMVYSLRGETEGYPVAGEGDFMLPPFHPNCRCTVQPYVISRKSQAEIDKALARNDEFDPDVDRRTPAQREAYKKEQTLRRLANSEKKQFMRFNATLGADNYKTLGAFRTAKRNNTPKFQELQSAYRSAMAKQV